jgi:hypothetical protein
MFDSYVNNVFCNYMVIDLVLPKLLPMRCAIIILSIQALWQTVCYLKEEPMPNFF